MLDEICKYDLLGIVVVLLQVKFLCNLFNCLFHTKYISHVLTGFYRKSLTSGLVLALVFFCLSRSHIKRHRLSTSAGKA